MTEVAPGVLVHSGAVAITGPANGGDIANLGIIVGTRSVAVVDTGSTTKVGSALLAAVRARTALPVSHVILTHVHPDHSLGAAAFRGTGPGGADPEVVAHTAFGAALDARADAYRDLIRRALGEPAAAAFDPPRPTTSVTATLTIDLGDRRLLLAAWATAHTNSDLTVLDETTGTLFAGDLVFDDHLPVIDGSLTGWIGVLDRLAALPARRVVPGHGAPMLPFPAALAPQRVYLEALAEDVRARIAAGETMAEAVAGSPAPGTFALEEEFHRRNVTAAFAELEWE